MRLAGGPPSCWPGASPDPNYTVFVNLGPATANYIFNEQILNADGTLTVRALCIQPLTGPLTGTVIVGQVSCGVTAVAQATTSMAPTTTTTSDCKPGYGYGDRSHRHCGPPGQTGDRPGGGNHRGLAGRPVASSSDVFSPWLLGGLFGGLVLASLIVPGWSRRGDRPA